MPLDDEGLVMWGEDGLRGSGKRGQGGKATVSSCHGSAPWARADFLLLGSSKEDSIQLTRLL